MADPKTALAIAGTAIQAFGAVRQGIADNNAARFEAQQLRQKAERDRQIAKQEADDFATNEARRRAALRARVGASGVTMEGTPLAVVSDLASEAEFQRLRILAGAETQATADENTARLTRFEGRNARTSGFLRAGSSLLTGASKFKTKNSPKKV